MAKTYSSIFREVLKQVKPTGEQRRKLLRLAKKALRLTNRAARRYKAKAMLAGSITRDTWMPDKMEFDVFILFPERLKEKKLEEYGLAVGRKVIGQLGGEASIEYAEHPYVSGLINGIDIDIVPCFAVKSAEQIKSAVDRTPFHVRFIEKRLPFRLSSDVRLLKKFLKSNYMYGADAKTEGFSGYVCELLVIHYGSLLGVLKAAEKWKPAEVIDLLNKKPDAQKLAKDFKSQPLILIDPTDKNRNTAAALSAFNFYKFKKLAKEFLGKPRSEIFFTKKLQPVTQNELMQYQTKRGTELIFVKFLPPRAVEDILWQQLRKFGERLQSILEETQYDFRVFGRDVFTDGKFISVVLLEMEVARLPAVQKRFGPPIFDAKDSAEFLKKYKDQPIAGPYVEGNRWTVEVNRKFLSAKDKLQDSLKDTPEILKAKGIPNLISDQLAKGFEVLSDADRIMQAADRNPDFGAFIRKYFEKEKLV